VAIGLVLLGRVVDDQRAIVEQVQVGFPHALVVLVAGIAAAADDRTAVAPVRAAVGGGVDLQVLAADAPLRVARGGVGGQQQAAGRQPAACTRQLVEVGLPAQRVAPGGDGLGTGDIAQVTPVVAIVAT